MVTYVNDLRLSELATGEGSGTWGTTTNTNLELIGEALGYGTEQSFSSDADATTTIGDGVSDPARAMYFKVTSAGNLTATRTLTIAPNTVSRVMFIENATSGSQSIAISQGSGANVTIATGKTAVVYLDGAGSGAAVVDAMALVDPGVTDTLAEVLTAGNTTTTDQKIQFRDSAIYINSSADGQLDLVADTEIQIATTTVDLNGALDVSGAITGTTATLTTADNSTQLTLISTDADANAGPKLKLRRDSASPADDDLIGAIDWTSENSSGDEHDFLNLTARMRDVTAGSEDVAFAWTAYLNGTGREIQSFVNTDAGAAQMVFNEDSQDIDFRVESNGNTHALFVDGGNEAVLVGKSTTALATAGLAFGTAGFASLTRDGAEPLNINRLSDDGKLAVFYKDGTEIGSLFTNGGAFVMKGNSASAPIQIQTVDGNEDIEVDPDGFIKMETAGSERLRINVNGSVGIGVADGDVTSDGNAARTYVGIIGTANRGRLNLGSTASNGADAGTLAFTNGANTLADISVDTTAGVQNTGTMYVNGTRSIKIQAAASDEVIFNEGSSDTDFRVESDGNTHMLFVDAGANEVGIGTNDPRSPLHVQTTHTETDVTSANTNSTLSVGNAGSGNGVYNAIKFPGNQQDMYIMSFNNGTQADRRMGFFLGSVAGDAVGDERLSITGDGNVGVGLTNPADYYSKDLVISAAAEGGITIVGGTSSSQYLMFADGTTGTAQYRGYLQYAHSSDTLIMAAAGNAMFNLSSAETVINDQGFDHDFRVESDNNANMLFVDGGNDVVVIGSTTAETADTFEVISSDTQTNVRFRNTNAGADGPVLIFDKASASPANDDNVGDIRFIGKDSAGNAEQFARLLAESSNVTSGAEDATVSLEMMVNGSNLQMYNYSHVGAVFNDQSSGSLDFRVETTSASHMIYANGGDDVVTFDATSFSAVDNRTATGVAIRTAGRIVQTCTNGGNAIEFNVNGQASGAGSINVSGTTTTYNTSSDVRLKENIVAAPSASDDIDAIQVRSFDWKADGSHQKYGMVAQELLSIAPDAVAQGETEEDMMGVDYSKLVPMLIKEIQSLRARVAQLESN